MLKNERDAWTACAELVVAAGAGAFFGSIMQRLQVRFYSISSSPAMHPKSIHITCAVVYMKTATGARCSALHKILERVILTALGSAHTPEAVSQQ